jgi:succinate dehydrogenase / fumarate reductase cytochrome b subunit
MIFSITHRISGITFAISLPFLALWIGSSFYAPSLFEVLSSIFNFPLIKIVFVIWFFALNHHLLNGLKYFFWTFAKGMDLSQVYLISYLILCLNIIMTALFTWSIFV